MKTLLSLTIAIACTIPALGMEKAPKEKEFIPVHIASQPEFQFPGVFRINDGLYVGKVNDGFYMSMERVDESNIDKWGAFALQQLTIGEKNNLKTAEGSYFFLRALSYYNEKKIKELWVAYASRRKITGPAMFAQTTNSNPDIEMFVGVITSHFAFITSHMGVSRSVEAELDLNNNPALRVKQPDQSIHLHSFAAKIMLLKNKWKAYMLTRPVPVMRDILVKKMPQNTVFVGDNIYKQEVINAIDLFHFGDNAYNQKQVLEKGINEPEYSSSEEDKFIEDNKNEIRDLNEKITLLKNNPPRITLHIKHNHFTIPIFVNGVSHDFTFSSSSPDYSWMALEPFRPVPEDISHPYVLIDQRALANVKPLMGEYK